jgi:hypothetical protein
MKNKRKSKLKLIINFKNFNNKNPYHGLLKAFGLIVSVLIIVYLIVFSKGETENAKFFLPPIISILIAFGISVFFILLSCLIIKLTGDGKKYEDKKIFTFKRVVVNKNNKKNESGQLSISSNNDNGKLSIDEDEEGRLS